MTEDPNLQQTWSEAALPKKAKPKANVLIFILAPLILAVGGGLAYIQIKGGGEKLVLEKCCDDILLGPKTALFVRAETPVRTKPSLEEGRTAYSYRRGATVTGEVVLGPDGKTRWLKQAADGWYVRTKDLSTGGAPRLTSTFPDEIVANSAPLTLRQIPDAKAPILVTLPAGSPIQRIGRDQNGFVEIVFDHPVYRVGYSQD
jgi:hypothetical protein